MNLTSLFRSLIASIAAVGAVAAVPAAAQSRESAVTFLNEVAASGALVIGSKKDAGVPTRENTIRVRTSRTSPCIVDFIIRDDSSGTTYKDVNFSSTAKLEKAVDGKIWYMKSMRDWDIVIYPSAMSDRVFKAMTWLKTDCTKEIVSNTGF